MMAVAEGKVLENAEWDLDFVQMVLYRIEGGDEGERSVEEKPTALLHKCLSMAIWLTVVHGRELFDVHRQLFLVEQGHRGMRCPNRSLIRHSEMYENVGHCRN